MKPDDIAKGNNYSKLTNKQVDTAKGWRLLHKHEILERRTVMSAIRAAGKHASGLTVGSNQIQMISESHGNVTVWDTSGSNIGTNPDMIYRTKLSPNKLAEFIRPDRIKKLLGVDIVINSAEIIIG